MQTQRQCRGMRNEVIIPVCEVSRSLFIQTILSAPESHRVC